MSLRSLFSKPKKPAPNDELLQDLTASMASAFSSAMLASKPANRFSAGLTKVTDKDAPRKMTPALFRAAISTMDDTELAEIISALGRARTTAMQQAAGARAPECGDFGAIAQDLDASMAMIKGAVDHTPSSAGPSGHTPSNHTDASAPVRAES